MLEEVNECSRPLTEGDIRALEDLIGASLPTDYRSFLLRYNGGIPRPKGFLVRNMSGNPDSIVQVFFGIDRTIESSDVRWNYEVFKGRTPSNLFPIACTPSGDLVCLSLSGHDAGSVVLWDFYAEHKPPTYANVYYVAPSFEGFINALFQLEEC
jgi:hypothetical protein